MSEVKVKFKDENYVYDIDKPEDLERVQHYIGQGMLFDREGQKELGEARKKLENFDEIAQKAQTFEKFEARLTQIKAGDEAEKERFIQDLEGLGINLTKKETETLDDMADPNVKALKSQVSELERKLTQIRQEGEMNLNRQVEVQIKSELNTLAQKYSSDEFKGYPEFDQDKVLDYANKMGTTDYDAAYFAMNRSDIIEAEKKKLVENEKEMAAKRKAAKTEGPGGGEEPPDLPSIPKSYDDAVQLAISKAKQTGTKIVVED
jgi:hypothetical protein